MLWTASVAALVIAYANAAAYLGHSDLFLNLRAGFSSSEAVHPLIVAVELGCGLR